MPNRRPISAAQTAVPPPYRQLRVGLTLPRDRLYQRIDRRIDAMLEYVTDPDTGNLQQLQDTLQTKIDGLDEDIESATASVQREMDRMRSQFNAMEVALSKLQNQSSQLAGLIAQLPSYSFE